MDKETCDSIIQELERLYPEARPALLYDSPYELLVAVILSAQCTDERVNKVTRILFEEHSTPETMLLLSQPELEKYIFSCGFYRNKAAHILSASKDILERYGGEVPSTLEDLQTLAGVGRKTANVVYSVAFGGDAIAVDTHVFRVSNRLGIAKGKTPLQVEEGLNAAIPQDLWSRAHHWLIYHGRRVCHSQRPDCAGCTLNPWCEEYAAKTSGADAKDSKPKKTGSSKTPKAKKPAEAGNESERK
ncbi:MAG: endonuclease III [Clostridia bacterium]|nr:endonuclease III [Clostridia bacterium]